MLRLNESRVYARLSLFRCTHVINGLYKGRHCEERGLVLGLA